MFSMASGKASAGCSITSAGGPGQAPGPLWKRIGRLVLIWFLSVAGLGLVAYAIHLVIH